MTKPSEFETKWQEYLDSFQDQKALDAFLAKSEITIALGTSNMTVSAEVRNNDGTVKTPADSIMNLNGVTNKIVNLIILSEYKAGTTLNLVNEDNGNLWDITLPTTTKPIDLQLQFPKATVLTKSAGNTEIDLLTVVASPSQYNNHDAHDADLGGMILGEGISVEGINPVYGDVFVDGATITAKAVFPKDIWNLDKTYYYGASGQSYKPSNANGYKFDNVYTADGDDFYTKNIKVYKGDWEPWVEITDTKNPLEKLIIATNATAYIRNGNGNYNVNEIVGESKDKSKIYFNNNTIQHKNLQTIKNITIGNQWWSEVKIYPAVENCIVEAYYTVSVYPSSAISNTEFKNASWVQVVPSVQTADNPTYTYTFDGCTFRNWVSVACANHIVGDTPLLDGEGNAVTKTRWEWAVLDETTGYWYWTWAYEDNVSAEAKKLDPEGTGKYWRKVEETVYVSDNAKVENYDVIIGLKDCKVATQIDANTTKTANLTKDSNVFEVCDWIDYDINVKYDINGTVYTPKYAQIEEQMGTDHVILVKD